jgi:uncharacterized membrane protein
MEEIRRKEEELTLEELEAQKIELLPDREEMQTSSTAIAINIGGGAATAVSTAQEEMQTSSTAVAINIGGGAATAVSTAQGAG